MMTFYSAIGSYRIKNQNGRKVPYIQRLGKLHPISIPEFVIWSTLLWEVLTYDELKRLYDSQMKLLEGEEPDFDQLLDLLVKRKLVSKGLGYTGRDALYNMLSNAFVVPYHISTGRKTLQLLRMLTKGTLQLVDILLGTRKRALTADEQRVLELVEQTPLSTAEIIRCFERNITDVSSAEKVINGIYCTEDSDQRHIANEQFHSVYTNPVLEAISNLYLNRQILLELP